MDPTLQTALSSGQLSLLVWTAAALGAVHTILGPDHYIPFVMMAKADRWSRKKTLAITAACGLGHVVASIVIAALLILGGAALASWEGSPWAALQQARGSLAAWLLIGLGVGVAAWGLVSVARGRSHAHVHAHEDGQVHLHQHDHHRAEHMHAHGARIRALTPWVLFTVFILGPCESLIPLMLASWAVDGLLGAALVAGAFSLTTLLTIVGAVAVLHLGVSRLPLGRLSRWSTAIAGASLVLCGVSIEFLGL